MKEQLNVPVIVDHHVDGSNPFVIFGQHPLTPHEPSTPLVAAGGKVRHANNFSVDGLLNVGVPEIMYANAFPSPLNIVGEHRAPTPEEFLGEVERHTDVYQEIKAAMPDDVKFATNKKQLSEGLRDGKLVFIQAVEGLYLDPRKNPDTIIDQMVANGVRNFGLTWNFDNQIATPHNAAEDKGLTPFGREVVNYLLSIPGIWIDLSHGSNKSAMDTLDLAPNGRVIVSHAGLRTINPHTRNFSPEVAREVVKNEGMFCIPFVGSFVRDAKNEGRASVMDVVRTISEVRNVTGDIKHIGIGTDFGGIGEANSIPGLDDISTAWRNLYTAMKSTGEYTEEDMIKVLGENGVAFLERNLPNK